MVPLLMPIDQRSQDNRLEMTAAAQTQVRVARLLAAGAVVHVLSTLVVFALGRSRVVPHIISPTGVIPGDGVEYLARSVELGRNITQLGAVNEQIHIRLYAVSCAILGPIVGPNLLSLELISLPLYLAMLVLTYKIGETCFEPKVGLLAAFIAGLFPSLLLHETQPLRDPVFIVLMLSLVWLLIRLVTTRVSPLEALICTAAGCALLWLNWMIRDAFLPINIGILTLSLIAWVATSVKERRAAWLNLACLLLLLAALLFIPKIFSGWLPPKVEITAEQMQLLIKFRQQQTRSGQTGMLGRINDSRTMFSTYPSAGSNIDVDRRFNTYAELFVYLPRAVLIGLFAPFPTDWLTTGEKHGRLGRVVAGVETGFFYLLAPFVVAAVWRSRRSVSAWYLLAVVLLGAAALGLVVLNLGALFRLRYGFWILLIILGCSFLAPSLKLDRVTRVFVR